jgi:hypothetical protein
MTNKYKAVSLSLQELARVVSNYLKKSAGEPIAFVLIVSVDNTAQYVSNASREDGRELIESLLARWQAGRADIPAHYNPDLIPTTEQPVPDAEAKITALTWARNALGADRDYWREQCIEIKKTQQIPAQPVTDAEVEAAKRHIPWVMSSMTIRSVLEAFLASRGQVKGE